MAASNKPARSRRPDFCAIWTAPSAERLDMGDGVFRGGILPGRCHRSAEFVLVTRQEGDEILCQKQIGGFQPALRRETGCQQRIIKAIQHELIECPVRIRRGHVGVQRGGLVSFGNRQLMLTGARQGESRE